MPEPRAPNFELVLRVPAGCMRDWEWGFLVCRYLYATFTANCPPASVHRHRSPDTPPSVLLLLADFRKFRGDKSQPRVSEIRIRSALPCRSTSASRSTSLLALGAGASTSASAWAGAPVTRISLEMFAKENEEEGERTNPLEPWAQATRCGLNQFVHSFVTQIDPVVQIELLANDLSLSVSAGDTCSVLCLQSPELEKDISFRIKNLHELFPIYQQAT